VKRLWCFSCCSRCCCCCLGRCCCAPKCIGLPLLWVLKVLKSWRSRAFTGWPKINTLLLLLLLPERLLWHWILCGFVLMVCSPNRLRFSFAFSWGLPWGTCMGFPRGNILAALASWCVDVTHSIPCYYCLCSSCFRFRFLVAPFRIRFRHKRTLSLTRWRICSFWNKSIWGEIPAEVLCSQLTQSRERIGSFQWVKLVKNTPEAIEHFLWLGKPFAKAFLFFVSTLRLLPFLADATVLLLLKLTTKLMILMSSGGPLKTQLS